MLFFKLNYRDRNRNVDANECNPWVSCAMQTQKTNKTETPGPQNAAKCPCTCNRNQNKTPIPKMMLECLRNAMQMQSRLRVHEEIKCAVPQNKQRCVPNVRSESLRRDMCS
jgi:hypothetical protein